MPSGNGHTRLAWQTAWWVWSADVWTTAIGHAEWPPFWIIHWSIHGCTPGPSMEEECCWINNDDMCLRGWGMASNNRLRTFVYGLTTLVIHIFCDMACWEWCCSRATLVLQHYPMICEHHNWSSIEAINPQCCTISQFLWDHRSNVISCVLRRGNTYSIAIMIIVIKIIASATILSPFLSILRYNQFSFPLIPMWIYSP